MTASTKAHLEVFASEYHMLKFFEQYLFDLDADASARLAPFLFVYKGELVYTRNLYEFLMYIEDLTALGIDVAASAKKNHAFLVFFHDTPKDPSKFVKAVQAKVDIKVEDIPLSTTFKEPEAPVIKEETPAAPVKDVEAILAGAEALRNDGAKSAAKAALEAYALQHGVSLIKSKTFDGMLEDLKAAL